MSWPAPASSARGWLLAAAGFGALACALTWPLAAHLSTHLVGDPSGDTGVYVWNVWIFRHELLLHHRLPFSTDHLFGFSGAADFSLHNYAAIANLLALPMVGRFGPVAAYNLVLLISIAASGFATFALARRLGLRNAAAFFAGALFMASPVLTARQTAHLSLVAAAPLPLFVLMLLRTFDRPSILNALLVGVSVAAALYSDAYYGVYCVLIGALICAHRFTRIESTAIPAARWLRHIVEIVAASFAAVILWRWLSGRTAIVLGPVTIGLRTLYTPVLVLAACVGCRLWLRHRPLPRLHDPAGELRRLAGLAAVSVLTCVALISPVLVGLAVRLFNERLPDTAILWRSSPRGLDLLAYVVPNPIHPLFGMQTRSWFMPPYPDAFPEFIGSFSIAAFVVLIVAARSGALPRLWVTFTAFFIALSLGPFVHVAGVNTYVPGPWAVLRYIPIVGAARSPARFVIVAMLGLAILCGFAIEALCRRRTAAAWKPLAAIVAVIAFELLPAPRPIYSAAIPNVYRLVAEGNGEPGRLLDLPTGIRDGTSSIGNFTAANEFFQTGHRRPLIGGYLSRVSTWRKRENARSPMLHVLFALSEGQPVAAEKLERARLARDAFLRRSCVRFVVIDKVRASSALRAFAEQALRLSLTYEDATHALFAPIDPPACAAPQRD